MTLEEVFHKLVDRVNFTSEAERVDLHDSITTYFQPNTSAHSADIDSSEEPPAS